MPHLWGVLNSLSIAWRHSTCLCARVKEVSSLVSRLGMSGGDECFLFANVVFCKDDHGWVLIRFVHLVAAGGAVLGGKVEPLSFEGGPVSLNDKMGS